MNQLDIYYRALLDYRKQTVHDHACSSLRGAIAAADTEQDRMSIIRSTCTIDEDWVEAIEKGLIHVEKAIKEERQFIRSNGEIIPIEKVKHVSRDSVEHLAKHSNLITRYEEGETITPEKLYTVERLNDYTVYENRFLYMLLCYLRDFVTIRYNDILELTNRYEATVVFDKKIITGKQKMSYSVSMHDIKRDDPYLSANNPSRAIIDRINLILKVIISFLNHPLMQEVSKVPMLKPPITKTNVLKMNNNFKGAVALYEFIIAYDKDGYEVHTETIELAPFRDELADELAEAGGLISFLTYEYGLGINKELRDSYAREEERRKAAQIAERAERIEVLKRRLKNSEITIEEYTATLEDQLRDLKDEAIRAESLADELEIERKTNERLISEVEALSETVEKLCADIEELKHKHFEELQRLKQEHEDAMHALIVKHEEEVAALTEKYETRIAELKAEHAAEIQKLKDDAAEAARAHAKEISDLQQSTRERIEQIKSECDDKVKAAEDTLATRNSELEESRREYAELLEKKRISEARIKALGGIEGDYTSRDRFNELEREYNAFTALYRKQWEETKKSIKKQHLNINNLKAQKEKKKDKETKDGSDSN